MWECGVGVWCRRVGGSDSERMDSGGGSEQSVK